MRILALISLTILTQLACVKRPPEVTPVYPTPPYEEARPAAERAASEPVRPAPPPPKPYYEKNQARDRTPPPHSGWRTSMVGESSGSSKPYPAYTERPPREQEERTETTPVPVEHVVEVKRVVEVKNETVFAQHPPHFYQYEAADVAFIIGNPKVQDTNSKTLIPLEGVPKSESYIITLKGDPINDFEVSPASQTIAGPAEGSASFAYFTVIPKKAGPAKLVYYIQVKREGNEAGVGIPKLERPITVEVSQKTWKYRLKKLPWEGIITGIAGAVGAWMLTLLNSWWKKRHQKAKKKPKE